MLDRDGYRPNVGIVLLNHRNEVFWAKRIREDSWQFPQGGINPGENPLQAMYRELYEEIGLRPEQVKLLGRTRTWLRYNVPERYVRRGAKGVYKGQKQIWFLLRLVTKDSAISLRATSHPEFDAWRWYPYSVPLETVIEFKRGVYAQALAELSAFFKSAKYFNAQEYAVLNGVTVQVYTSKSYTFRHKLSVSFKPDGTSHKTVGRANRYAGRMRTGRQKKKVESLNLVETQ